MLIPCRDTLAEMITYDWEGYNSGNSKHSPYYGLVEGTCVCSGYADAYFNLCYYGGLTSAVSSCITSASKDGTPDHRISMVNLISLFKGDLRENAAEIEAAIHAISGVLSDDSMSLEDYREERLKRYESIG